MLGNFERKTFQLFYKKNYFLNFFNYKKIMASKEFVTVIVESPIGEFVS